MPCCTAIVSIPVTMKSTFLPFSFQIERPTQSSGVQVISSPGLRPSWGSSKMRGRWSWRLVISPVWWLLVILYHLTSCPLRTTHPTSILDPHNLCLGTRQMGNSHMLTRGRHRFTVVGSAGVHINSRVTGLDEEN